MRMIIYSCAESASLLGVLNYAIVERKLAVACVSSTFLSL